MNGSHTSGRRWALRAGQPARRLIALGLLLVLGQQTARAEITFLNTWGSGIGQFGTAQGVAVGPTGDVYVVDQSNHRVERFDRSGNYLGQWGSVGGGNGQFSIPWGVAVSSTGVVYIADFSNARVQRFTSNGSFMSTWGTYGAGNGQFSFDAGVAVSPSGSVYTSETGNDRVQEFSASGSFVTQWGSAGAGLGNFNDPYYLAVSPGGDVFVAEFGNDRVQRFDSTGGFQTAWNTGDGPLGIAVSATGDVYVAEYFTHFITKYDSSGNVLRTFGGPGAGNGQFAQPEGLAIAPTGDLYVVDQGHDRVQRFFDSEAWVSGSNALTNPGVGAGQILGASQTLSTGKTLNVTGTTTINSGGTLALAGGVLTSPALTLNGAGASLQITSGTYSIGTFTISGGAAYQVAAGQTFTTTGDAIVGAGGRLTVNGLLLGAGVNVTGVLEGTGQISGPLTNNNFGEVRVAAGQRLLFSSTSAHSNAGRIEAIGGATGGAEVEFSGAVTNAVGTGLILAQGGANLRFSGGLTNDGSLAAAFGQANVFGDVTNNATGRIRVNSGANALFADDCVQNGTLTISPGSTVVVYGSFSGSGGFTGGGTLSQQGDLRPGNSPALVHLGGDLVLGASANYHLELGGATIGTQYDSLSILGSASLGGTLNVELVNGFNPSLAQTFTALTFRSRSGDFASYSGLDVGGHLTLRKSFTSTSLLLTARPAIDGDINLDGTVNIFDINAVSSNWSTVGPQGDANGDGIVNIFDINFISSNWGATGGSSTAVPEPATIVLLAVAGLAACWRFPCATARIRAVPVNRGENTA